MRALYKISLSIVGFFVATLTAGAQKAEQADHTYNIEGSIEKMILTDAGVLLITHGKGLAGIKPKESQLVFNFDDYGKVKEEEITIVPNSPYVILGQTGFGGISAKQSVINFVSGKRVFDTKANGWKAAQQPVVLLPENKLVVSGQRTAKEKYAQAIGIYDLATAKEEKLIVLKGVETMVGTPSIIDGALYLPTTKGLTKYDLASNSEVWNLGIKNIDYVLPANDGQSLYAFVNKGKNHEVNKVSFDGRDVWGDGKKLKGKVANFEVAQKGLAIVSNVESSGGGLNKLVSAAAESNISFLDINTGEDLWEKAPKTKGYVQHFYIVEDGILFGIYEGGINKISFDGTPLFKKPLKTGENIHTMALTKQGLIYITDTDADIVNLETGESVWPKPIKYKKAENVVSTYDQERKRYLICTGEEIISVNEDTGDISTFAQFKFDEKEVPNFMAVRKRGVLLTSDQNIMMFDFDGNELFHLYHKSPGRSTFGKVMGGMMAVASTAMTAAMSATAGANRSAFGSVNDLSTYNDYGKDAKRAADMFASISDASFEYLSTRFKASAATKDSQFVLTSLDEGVGLIKLSKETGEVEKKIVLKDKKPEYEVDEFGGMLFYKADNSTIYAYSLK